MLLDNLKKEYALRYNITRYKKLYKLYLYNRFEINNYNLLYYTLENQFIKRKDKNEKDT